MNKFLNMKIYVYISDIVPKVPFIPERFYTPAPPSDVGLAD
jgi:hypothetical protein